MAKKPDEQIIEKKQGGTGAFGLYFDVVVYNQETGVLTRQERFFLHDNVMCRYQRVFGNKRAAWKARAFPSVEEARAWLRTYTANLEASTTYGVEMQFKPLVIELTTTDVEALGKVTPPYARFAGTLACEKVTGKIDDEKWRPAK
jgi:hypothetical protein